MRRQRNQTTGHRLTRIERAIAKREQKNAAYLRESIALEEAGHCHFCEGSGGYQIGYDDGNVRIECKMCDGTGRAQSLESLRTLLARGTAFDPKELRRRVNALGLALDGKVTTAP